MHEMSYVSRFVNKALETANEKNAARVEKVIIDVGDMAGLEDYYLDKYYKIAVKDTILDNSVLEINHIPVKAECDKCGKIYHPCKENNYLCDCGAGSGKIVEGRGLVLRQVVMDL